jgi:predicted CoA-binding protein
MDNKKTLVIGASLNPERYAYRAVKLLRKFGHPVEAIGLKEGEIDDVQIHRNKELFTNVHTVTMYLGPKNQTEYYQYILEMKPQRIVFNPGTENPEFESIAKANSIEVVEDCTLVMLNRGAY